jgi:chaperonin cofactor prefoldin
MLKHDLEHCKNRIMVLDNSIEIDNSLIEEITELLRSGYHPDHVVKVLLWEVNSFPQ